MRSNKNQRLHIRIEEKDYLLLQVIASKANMSVSAYCRMMIVTAITPLKGKIRNGEMTYEDCEQFLEAKKAFRESFKNSLKRK